MGTEPGSGLQVNVGDSNTITGWTVTAGTVDYIGYLWTTAEGSRSLDMSGTPAGTISQVVTGFVAGATSQTYVFDGAGFSSTNMGWTLKTLDCVASGSSLPLSFTKLQRDCPGPASDNVSITAWGNET